MLLVFVAVEPEVAPLPLVAPEDAVPPAVPGVVPVVPLVVPDSVLPLPVVGADVPVPVDPDKVVPLPVEPVIPAVPVLPIVPVLPVVPEVPVVPDVPAPTVVLGAVLGAVLDVVLGAVLGVVIAPPLAPRVPPVVAPPPVTEFWLDTVPRLPAEAPASLLRVEPLDAVCAMAPPATSDATRRVRSLLIKISPVLSGPEHNHCIRAWMELGRWIGRVRSDVGKLPSGPRPSRP
jgi:hypothetical protein